MKINPIPVITAVWLLFSGVLFAGPADTCACLTDPSKLKNSDIQGKQYDIMRESLKKWKLETDGIYLDSIANQSVDRKLGPTPMFNTLMGPVLAWCNLIAGPNKSMENVGPANANLVNTPNDFGAYKCAMACAAVNNKLFHWSPPEQATNSGNANEKRQEATGNDSKTGKESEEKDSFYLPFVIVSVLFFVSILSLIFSLMARKRISFLHKKLQHDLNGIIGSKLEDVFKNNTDKFIEWLRKEGYTVEKIVLPLPVIDMPPLPEEPPLPKKANETKDKAWSKAEPAVSGQVSLFAEPPNGSLLHRVKEEFIPHSTYFEIALNSRNSRTGIFKLVEHEPTRIHAFSMMDGLKDACELHSTGSPASGSKVDSTNGSVELQDNGYWQITKKIVLKW